MKTLVIKNLYIQAANLLDSNILAGGPRLLAAQGYLTALSFACSANDQDPVQLMRFAYVHHDFNLRGVKMGDLSVGMFKKGNFAFGVDDFVGSNPKGGLSQQTNIEGDLCVSLIAQFNKPFDIKKAQEFVEKARFSGGSPVVNPNPYKQTQVSFVNSCFDSTELEVGLDKVGSGFIFVRNDDYLKIAENPLDSIVAVCSRVPKTEKNVSEGVEPFASWLAPAVFGYVLLETPEVKEGSRQNLPHAYCEPLHGIGQYHSLSSNKFFNQTNFFNQENCMFDLKWSDSRHIELRHNEPLNPSGSSEL